jgi:hypothetical protein
VFILKNQALILPSQIRQSLPMALASSVSKTLETQHAAVSP